jgi:ribosomal protein S18 acetylase RimI-like enzyme
MISQATRYLRLAKMGLWGRQECVPFCYHEGGTQRTMGNHDPLHNLVWKALETVHTRFAIGDGLARRYPEDVAPFAAIAESSHAAFRQLTDLLAPGERVYLLGERPRVPETLAVGEVLHTFQMFGPGPPFPEAEADHIEVAQLRADDADEMFALITLAFPGFYRPRTHEMGMYFGIRVNGGLVAMAGERLCIPGFYEISGVCTHPAHTGKGYARTLMVRLMQEHENAGLRSFLHVGKRNPHAVAIYERMGFHVADSKALWPVSLRE